MALETAGQGITCNAICPGYVLTPLVEAQIPDQMKAHNMDRETVIREVMLARQPSRQFATVEEIGGTTVFLCSAAADQITGTTISRRWRLDGALMRVRLLTQAIRAGGAAPRDPAECLWQVEEEGGGDGGQTHQSGPAGRRRAWRLHLGRARPAARGRDDRDRGDLRHLGRRAERRGAEGGAGDAAGARARARTSTGSGSRWARSAIMRMALVVPRLSCRPAASADLTERLMPFSPAETFDAALQPLRLRPVLRNPLERVVDAVPLRPGLRRRRGRAFYVAATNVRSGKIRVFSGDEITPDAILASACLPTHLPGGRDRRSGDRPEAYWDGGYTGNPALFPLFDPALPDDIVVVNINPLRREAVPRTGARTSSNRINEISFNSSLLRELRAIDFVKRLIAEGRVEAGAMKDVLVHIVADDALMTSLSAATKLVPTLGLLWELKAAGREAADAFLDRHGGAINRESSVDLGALVS